MNVDFSVLYGVIYELHTRLAIIPWKELIDSAQHEYINTQLRQSSPDDEELWAYISFRV
jgi:hypothetical protein